MTVRLFLFGSPTIEHAGEILALPFERRSQLLVHLALRRNWVGRAELAAMLWPEQSSGLAAANLRKTLFRMRAAPWPEIERAGGAVRIAAETDVHAHETAVRELRLHEAVAWRHGELLAGFDDDANEAWTQWLAFERDRMRVSWRRAALDLLGGDIGSAQAIALSAQLLAYDPLDEAALRAHMNWLARGGQAAAAGEAYEAFAARLSLELGLIPGAELISLRDTLLAASKPRAVANLTKLHQDGNDGFIGRRAELNQLTTLLARDDCRLLCLTGPGGVGKTRLAQRAMQDLAPRFTSGAVFVSFEDVDREQDIGARLARDIGIPLSGNRAALDQAVGYLSARQLLLVLDNFEQLTTSTPVLQRLLRHSPQLKILVTSRSRLAAANEWLLALTGMPFPDLEDRETIESFDAALLFIRAARRVDPHFVVSQQATAIIDICRQLEGLPLALELAAAWARILSCESIANELRQGSGLLQSHDASRPARQASIEAVFEQSWQLMNAAERAALSRLSLFRGGFSAEAARDVAGASVPVLGGLSDKSLLRKEDDRIALHPLVQQMAAAHLNDRIERASSEQAHALYFLRLLHQRHSAVKAGDRDALQQIGREFENCRAAWKWAIDGAHYERLADAAATLAHFCESTGRLTEGRALLRDAHECASARADCRVQACLLSLVAKLDYRLDHYADAGAAAAQALALTSKKRDPTTRLRCLQVMGTCSLRLRRLADAKRHFSRALKEARSSSTPSDAAAALDHLALAEKALGNYGDASRLTVEALAHYRSLNDAAGTALCLNNLSVLYMAQEDLVTSVQMLKEGLSLCDRQGLSSTRMLILSNLTQCALKTGDDDAAHEHALQALEAAEAAGNRAGQAWLKIQFARLALRRGELAVARENLAELMEVAIAIDRPELQACGAIVLGEVLMAQGERDCARQVMAFVAQHPSVDAPLRSEASGLLAQWPGADVAGVRELGLDLAELAHRSIAEARLAFSPLIAQLLNLR